MDIPFDITRWRPALPSRDGDTVPNSAALEALSARLADQTKDVQRHPYDPENWLERSKTLRELNYPELAMGDAFKASLLCAQTLSQVDDDGQRVWRLGQGSGFWMLESSQQDGELRERLAGLSERARKAEEKNLSGAQAEGKGQFHPRQYPWLEPSRFCRGDELIERINGEFDTNAHAVLNVPSFCEVRRHAFGNNGPESRDTLGVFAKRPIPKDTTIIIDRTRIWGCNGPGSHGDLKNLHGGAGCGDPVHPNMPDEDAGLEMRWIRDEAGKDASTALLFCRLLFAAITDNGIHASPLDHHLIARLTPSYGLDGPAQTFYRSSDFEIPNRALRQFGVDIFADLEWDTWVLFTIFARVENNSCGCLVSEALMPLFSAFNHSCEPNVAWARDAGLASSVDGEGHGKDEHEDNSEDKSEVVKEEEEDDDIESWAWSNGQSLSNPGIDHATVEVKTLTDVKEGEQLFVEYDGFEHEKPLAERRERLRKWLVGDCMCTRCVREEAEAVGGEEREKKETRGGLNGTFPRQKSKAWDDSEDVQFPEEKVEVWDSLRPNYY